MNSPRHIRHAFAATAMALTLAVPTSASEGEYVRHAPGVTGRYARTADGISIWYETEGEGLPIVVIPGGPGASHNAMHLTHHVLAAQGKVIYVDNRGRGRSDPGKGRLPYRIEGDVEDLEAVRRSLGIDRWVVYGRSYGGMVAQAYAIRHPDHVAGLVISNSLDGASAWQEYNIDGVKSFLRTQFPDRWERIERMHDAGILTSQDTLSVLFSPLGELYNYSAGNDSSYRAQATAFADPEHPSHNRDVYECMVGLDPDWEIDGTLAGVEFAPDLAQVTCPALVLSGRYDRITPPAACKRIAEALPNAQLVTFERSGHRPEFEESSRWLSVMTRFLDDVRHAEQANEDAKRDRAGDSAR